MADWVMPLFTIVVAVALLMETLVIVAMFIALRRLTGRIEQITDRVQGRIVPLISQLQLRLDEIQPRISCLASEGSELMHTARHQAERTDRAISEASDRIMARLVYADETITRTLESLENTAARVRRTVWAPVRSAKALLVGIQTGFSSYGRHVRQPLADRRNGILGRSSTASSSLVARLVLLTFAGCRIVPVWPPSGLTILPPRR